VRVSVWLSGVPVHSRVTPPHRPSIRFLFVSSELCFRLPPHPVSRRRSCLPLSVPANRPEKDLHLQHQRHAWHTKKGPSHVTKAPLAAHFAEWCLRDWGREGARNGSPVGYAAFPPVVEDEPPNCYRITPAGLFSCLTNSPRQSGVLISASAVSANSIHCSAIRAKTCFMAGS
jgi:hypothetical protein